MKLRVISRLAVLAGFLVAVGCSEQPKVIPAKSGNELPSGVGTGGGGAKPKPPSGKLD